MFNYHLSSKEFLTPIKNIYALNNPRFSKLREHFMIVFIMSCWLKPHLHDFVLVGMQNIALHNYMKQLSFFKLMLMKWIQNFVEASTILKPLQSIRNVDQQIDKFDKILFQTCLWTPLQLCPIRKCYNKFDNHKSIYHFWTWVSFGNVKYYKVLFIWK